MPENKLSQALLKSHGFPIISISAKLPNKDLNDPNDIIDAFSKFVDIAVSSDSYEFAGESSIIDMTSDKFEILREGAGMSKLKDFISE